MKLESVARILANSPHYRGILEIGYQLWLEILLANCFV